MRNYLDEFRLNMKYYLELRRISQAQLSIICDCGTGTIVSVYFPNAPYSSSPTGSSHSLLVSAPAGSNVTWLK